MAELLLQIHDNTSDDPVQDQRCYKAGDIIMVKEDGSPWSASEISRVVKIPGLSADIVNKFLEDDVQVDPFTLKPLILRRRKWRIAFEQLPQQIKDKLATGQGITVTVKQVKAYIVNKTTGEVWSGN